MLGLVLVLMLVQDLPQGGLILNLLGESVLLLQDLHFVVEWDDAFCLEVFDLLCAVRLPLADVRSCQGAKRSAGPDGGFDGGVEIGLDDAALGFIVSDCLYFTIWVESKLDDPTLFSQLRVLQTLWPSQIEFPPRRRSRLASEQQRFLGRRRCRRLRPR